MEIGIVFIVALFGTIIINRLLLVFSKNLGTRGSEDIQVRWAATSKPSLGGFAYYIVFLGIFVVIGLIDFDFLIFTKKQLLGVFIAVSCGFCIGFADDTYNTNPKLKALGQLASAIVLFIFDIQIELIPHSQLINFILTTIWTIALMNSINMLDNMDGITASTSLMIIITFVVVLLQFKNIDFHILLTFIAVCGSLAGFLYHNWYPSKMYMGDAGSQFLGIFLSIFSIPLLWNNPLFNSGNSVITRMLIPALVFIVPLIDTITVIYYRLKRKSSPFIGGADHTTHHLVYLGFKERQVAWFFILINLIGVFFISIIIKYKYFPFELQIIVFIVILLSFVFIEYLYLKGKLKPKLKKNDSGNLRISLYEKILKKNSD
jgi:UDP-GlcNAc:undecaprenyl-phosphate/decaprenyl-phosphate GlcNAc-1-phosphate transferase